MKTATKALSWILAAAASAFACSRVIQFDTPIDRALPLLAVAVTCLAWRAHESILGAVLLIAGGEMVLFDERTRLVWFGLVMAAAFVAAAVVVTRAGRMALDDGAALVVTALVVLRWIPFDRSLVWRELLVIALAVVLLCILRATPVGMAIAVAVGLLTPAIPLRSFLFPLLVIVAMLALRAAGMPPLRAEPVGLSALALVILFFPWSGVVARSLPLLFVRPPQLQQQEVGARLARGESATLELPRGARSLVVFGSNVSRLRRGAVAARIEPGGIPIRIGDFADWGFLRREQFFASRNPLPRDPAGTIRGYGYAAWVDAAGRVAIPSAVRSLTIRADSELPPDAFVEIRSIEYQP